MLVTDINMVIMLAMRSCPVIEVPGWWLYHASWIIHWDERCYFQLCFWVFGSCLAVLGFYWNLRVVEHFFLIQKAFRQHWLCRAGIEDPWLTNSLRPKLKTLLINWTDVVQRFLATLEFRRTTPILTQNHDVT